MSRSPFLTQFWRRRVELYEFKVGDEGGVVLRYADGEKPCTYAGAEYEPIPIRRGKITKAGGLDNTEMNITVPVESEIAELYRVHAPAFAVTLTIRSVDYRDSDGLYASIIWIGRVLNCRRDVEGEMDVAELACKPWNSLLRNNGLRRNYQLSCPHQLYGPQCQASKAATERTATVASVSGTALTLVDGWKAGEPDSNFRFGLVEWDGENGREVRMVYAVSGNTLTFNTPIAGLSPGDEVSVYYGCARTREHCAGLHNNIVNYGGQPWIPLVNPVNKTQT